MNAFDRAKTAYASAEAPTRTPRSIEYEVFAQVTHRLKAAEAQAQQNFALLARALYDNRALWSVMAADVAGDGNGLPLALRQQIYELARFTNKHTSKVLAGTATALALIDINTAIMRGLRKEARE